MRFWVLAEFPDEHALLAAVVALRQAGLETLDAHSPVPIEGMSEALGLRASRVSWAALIGGLGGAAVGYGVQWYTSAVAWPLLVAGRPAHSAPSFIPIAFETAILVAAGSIIAALVALFGFPHVAHPVFEVDAFRSASIDGFWVSLWAAEPSRRDTAKRLLEGLSARQISVIEERT